MRSLVLVSAAAAAVLAFRPAPAAEPPAGRLRVFRAARIVTMEGPDIERGALLVRGAKVERVLAEGDEIPEGAEVIDLGGATVLPGLVNPLSGITHSSGRRGGASGPGLSGPGGTSDNRRLRAADGIALPNATLRRLGRTGYAALAIAPAGRSFLGGLAVVVRPRGAAERDKVIVKDAAYLSMSYTLGQPMRETAERELRKAAQARKKALEDRDKKTEGEKKEAATKEAEKKDGDKDSEKKEKAEKPERPPDEKKSKDAPPAPPPPDPLVEVFAGDLTAFLRIDSAAALDHLLRVVDRLPLSFGFVLISPPFEREIVSKIALRKPSISAVVLDPRLGSYADTSVLFNAARLFHEAGLDVALVPPSDGIDGHGEVFFALGEMVKAGLPAEAALRAVTAVPAKLLGIAERFGSLGAGREASFAVLDGDPLSGSARVLRAYLEGEEVYREDPATGRTEGEALR